MARRSRRDAATHHESEDEVCGTSSSNASRLRAHVGQMRAHHAQVAELLAEASPLLARWRATADPAVGEQLADAYERMLDVLKVHLRREVVEIVPVAERVVTTEEWASMADHSVGRSRRVDSPPSSGCCSRTQPADRKSFTGHAPLGKVSGASSASASMRSIQAPEPG